MHSKVKENMTFAKTTILSGLRSRLSAQHGFTMIPAIMAMMVGTLLSLAAWAAADGDVGFTDKDRWARVAQQKANSGVSDYVQRIAENSGFWNQCDQPGDTDAIGLGDHAINDTDFGTALHPQRRWLPYATAGSADDREYNSQYTIDLLPIRSGDTCKPKSTSAQRMIDPQSGTFRIRVTGRAGPQVPANVPNAQIEAWRQTHWKRVSTVVEFRRNGFLDYAYFTDHEGRDPDLLSGTLSQREACRAYYQDDPGYPASPDAKAGRYRSSNCVEIQFASDDEIKGPMHTNDSAFVAAFGPTTGPLFGNPNKGDRVEVYDNGEDGSTSCPFRDVTRETPSATDGDCKKSARFNSGVTGAWGPAARYMDLPEENDDLKLYADESADEPGYTFYGTTRIVMNSNNTLTVTNALRYGATSQTLPYPPSGVIYVDDTVSSCPSNPDAKYPGVPAGCALLELSGNYNGSLTFGSATDIVIRGNIARQNSQTAVLGLIAEEYIRVRHFGVWGKNDGSVNTCTNWTDPGTTVTNIEAAILTLQRSFTVDAYSCGSSLGDLRVYGSLAQRWRGTVGRGSSGYAKDYNYDYTLKSQSPPRFLAPTAAVWKIIRMRQQVPACACTPNG